MVGVAAPGAVTSQVATFQNASPFVKSGLRMSKSSYSRAALRSCQPAAQGQNYRDSTTSASYDKQDGGSASKGLRAGALAAAALSAILLNAEPSFARLEGVNKPELLPKGPKVTVIDVAGFLTDGQEKRISQLIADLQQDTGFKLRVLAQNYPNTPGLAIKDYWGVDDDTVVFVADPNTGNILNFNVGANVDLAVPRNFWTRLAGKFGNKFYWQEQGEDTAIEAAVFAIDQCLKEPIGPTQCAKIPDFDGLSF
eukprot:jgi/Mesvir1/15867/Mv03413-RA.1